MTEPKIIGHLDAATRIDQAAADEQLVREASSVDGYRDYLMRAFGFGKRLERAVALVDPFDGDLHARSKSLAIAEQVESIAFRAQRALVCDISTQASAGEERRPGTPRE